MTTLFFASRYCRMQAIVSDPHCHEDAWQVEYCISRHLVTYTVDNTTHPLTQGSIIAIPPGFTHYQKLPAGTDTYLLKFSHSNCGIDVPFSLTLRGSDKEIAENLLVSLIYEHDGREPNRERMIAVLLELLLLRLERWSRISALDRDAESPACSLERVRMVGDFLRRNYSRSFTVDELARNACLSRSRFLELFRREFATSPLAFHTRVRMEKALELARYTGMSWQQIALQLGYEDAAYFSRVFRKCMGASPANYEPLQ